LNTYGFAGNRLGITIFLAMLCSGMIGCQTESMVAPKAGDGDGHIRSEFTKQIPIGTNMPNAQVRLNAMGIDDSNIFDYQPPSCKPEFWSSAFGRIGTSSRSTPAAS
jgi:hypothetical protein